MLETVTLYIRYVARGLIELISLLLFVRAILSWIPGARDTRFYGVMHMRTEPFVLPFRMLFDKIGIGQGFFLDLSFIATILTLQVIAAIL